MYQRNPPAPSVAGTSRAGEPMGPDDPRDSGTGRSGGVLGWWYALSAPREPPASAVFTVRERFRRGRLASLIILGLLVIDLISLPAGRDDQPTLFAGLAVLVVILVAAALNRGGNVTAAGLLLVATIDLALVGVVVNASGGQIDLVYLPLYDLLVIGELVAVSVLQPASVFVVAAVNAIIIIADLRFQPATPALQATLAGGDGYTVVIRPVALQFIVALVAFLWVRSALSALRRADRAEEIAELERREVERKAELEEGVRELLKVHVHLANGDFSVRTPQLRNPLLWQIGISLNHLIGRFARSAPAAGVGAESRAGPPSAVMGGQMPPAPGGPPMRGPILDPQAQSGAAWPAGQARWGDTSGGSPPPTSPLPPPSTPHPEDELPEWLRPFQPGG